VVVRGKAGAEVEFGNSLFLAENADGFIIDHQLKQEQSRGDARVLSERLPMIATKCGGEVVRNYWRPGGSSEAIDRQIKEAGLFNGICPKDVRKLVERMKDEIFSGALRRRAQTEGRVGILKNVFLGGTPLAKGFERRQLQVSWAVLAHNGWVAARLSLERGSPKRGKGCLTRRGGGGMVKKGAPRPPSGWVCPRTAVFRANMAQITHAGPFRSGFPWPLPCPQTANSVKFLKLRFSGQALPRGQHLVVPLVTEPIKDSVLTVRAKRHSRTSSLERSLLASNSYGLPVTIVFGSKNEKLRSYGRCRISIQPNIHDDI
jgi:hypothetical protein